MRCGSWGIEERFRGMGGFCVRSDRMSVSQPSRNQNIFVFLRGKTMYGWRGRIGLLVPSINTTMETEFWQIAPEGVSVHSARIAGGRHGTPEELRSMETASKKAAKEVAVVEPDVVVCGCTSGSFFEGAEWNRKICDQLTAITKAPTVTTAGGMA